MSVSENKNNPYFEELKFYLGERQKINNKYNKYFLTVSGMPGQEGEVAVFKKLVEIGFFKKIISIFEVRLEESEGTNQENI